MTLLWVWLAGFVVTVLGCWIKDQSVQGAYSERLGVGRAFLGGMLWPLTWLVGCILLLIVGIGYVFDHLGDAWNKKILFKPKKKKGYDY